MPGRLKLAATAYMLFLAVETFGPDNTLGLYSITLVTSLVFSFTKHVVFWRQLRMRIYRDIFCLNLVYIFYCKCYRSHSTALSVTVYLALVARYCVSQFLDTPWFGKRISVFEWIVPLVLEQLADLQLLNLQRLNRSIN